MYANVKVFLFLLGGGGLFWGFLFLVCFFFVCVCFFCFVFFFFGSLAQSVKQQLFPLFHKLSLDQDVQLELLQCRVKFHPDQLKSVQEP